MPRPQTLRKDARTIWQTGVDAVASDRLVRENVHVEGQWLHVGDGEYFLPDLGQIVVVGAGKAGAGMAAGLETALGSAVMRWHQLAGWINVPQGCQRPLKRIHLHPARPAGVNEPTEQGVEGAARILDLMSRMKPKDLCICLWSGGGSALLPAPVPGISLNDKRLVTQHLSAAGANIVELNTVRKQLSAVKGGRLAAACGAAQLVSLVISDVLGDPLDTIASGPTFADRSTPQQALDVLDRYGARQAGIRSAVFEAIGKQAVQRPSLGQTCQVIHSVIGNNSVAVEAAGAAAERLGYHHAMIVADKSEGDANQIGVHLARMATQMQTQTGPNCLISGGEPTVTLAPSDRRGTGGRNQQLVLAGLCHWLSESGDRPTGDGQRLLLSGGTDGEDGPTDAAGAWADLRLMQQAIQLGLAPADYRDRNDAYHFFEQTGGLIRTGPTHTNVCDVRVVLVS